MLRRRREEGERSERLHPGRVRRANTSARPLTGTARNLLRLARLVSRVPNAIVSRSASAPSTASRMGSPFQRRCIVNVRYASGRTPGGWKAHGTYVERESAKEGARDKGELDRAENDVEDRLGLAKSRSLSSLASSWQKAGDERIFKIILSPEDAGADFKSIANAVISRIEEHTGSPVSWGGVVHRNTDHPHAHLIVRGRTQAHEPLKLPRAMIRKGLREAAQASLTRQLGPRTMEDIRRQQREELTANRVTPLDRKMVRQAPIYGRDPAFLLLGKAGSPAERARLGHLKQLGLVNTDTQEGWLIRADAIGQLQQMKDLQDRARILFRSGVAISDPHAPMEFSSFSKK